MTFRQRAEMEYAAFVPAKREVRRIWDWGRHCYRDVVVYDLGRRAPVQPQESDPANVPEWMKKPRQSKSGNKPNGFYMEVYRFACRKQGVITMEQVTEYFGISRQRAQRALWYLSTKDRIERISKRGQPGVWRVVE